MIICVFMLLTGAYGAVISVNPGPLNNVANSVSGAGDGDTIIVQPGLYKGCESPIVLGADKHITIVGNSTAMPSTVIFECEGRGYAITAAVGSKGFVIERILIRNTESTSIQVQYPAHVTLSFVTIKNSKQSGVRMAMTEYSSSASITLNDCDIMDNSKRGIELEYVDAVITNTRVSRNAGTGIAMSYSALIISDSIIDGNVVSGVDVAGGISMTASTLDAYGCIVIDNVISSTIECYVSGGVYGDGGSVLTMSNCIISNNVGSDSTSTLGSGGVMVIESECILHSCILQNNTAVGEGGGGGMYISYSTVEINDTVMSDNIAKYGGAVSVDSSVITITMTQFLHNSALLDCGGAIAMYSTVGYMYDTVMVGNRGHYGGTVYLDYASNLTAVRLNANNNDGYYGGYAYLYRGSTLHVFDSEFVDNTASYGGMLYLEHMNPRGIFHNCIVDGNKVCVVLCDVMLGVQW